MIRPNELAAPGERAAHARLEELFERLDELPFADIAAGPDNELPLDEHDALMAQVEDLADGRGLGDLLDEARDAVRDALTARVAASVQLPGVLVAGGPRPEDEARAVLALVDAAAVAVVLDVLDPASAEALAGPAWRMLGMAPLGGSGAQVASGAPAPGAVEKDTPDPTLLGAPSTRDWAEAARGATAIDPGEIPAGRRQARVVIAAVIALMGTPMAFVAALDTGGPMLGTAAAVAVVVVCWTFATAGRR